MESTVHSARRSARRKRLGCSRAKMSMVALLQWMFIRASPDSRSLVIIPLKYVFNRRGRRNVLNDRSHSTDVIGNVHKMRSNLCTFGKNSQSHSAKASTAVLGRSLSAFSHLRHQLENSTSKTWGDGRSSAQYCKATSTGFPS